VRRPLLLGHRGARRGAPENTLAAFDLALRQGCDGFEFDLRRTADGRGFLCHDRSFERLRIASSTYAQIRQRAAARHRPAVCCIEDVLARYCTTAFLDIELKDCGLEDLVVAAVRQHRPRRYVVSSFLPEVLRALRRRAPQVPLGLIADTRHALDQWKVLPVSHVMPHRALLSSRLVEELHAAGKQVFVWTVNTERALRSYAAWGVDAIISDNTELLSRAFVQD
jgi:glycerophosphoryl diester phosphodiesterase